MFPFIPAMQVIVKTISTFVSCVGQNKPFLDEVQQQHTTTKCKYKSQK
jgi:hypothetical protein